jgi:hypothetical protein
MDANLISRALRAKYQTPQAVLKALGLSPTLLAMDSAMPMPRRRAFDEEEFNSMSEQELADLMAALKQHVEDRAALRRSRDGRDRITPDRRPRGRDNLNFGPQPAGANEDLNEENPMGESPWQGKDRGRFGQDAKPRLTFADRFPDAGRIRFW